METVFPIILILSALLAGAASPGPSFLLVARIAMGVSRKDAIAASIGMGVGGALFSILALLGLQAILTNIPIIYIILKVIGGFYLIYLSINIWRGANDPFPTHSHELINKAFRKAFFIGVITQISNPKTAIVYGSIFAALLPIDIPNIYFYILPPLVFIVEAGWYLLVTLVLSSSTPRAAYIRSKSLFDRIAGGIMAGLGIKLVSSASD